MDALLLEKARQAKAKADNEQALIDRLPQLEKEAQRDAQRAKLDQQKEMAKEMFEQALEVHRQRDGAFEANYQELRKAFRSFVATLKSDNRSYENVNQAAMALGYYLAADDPVFGLSADSQRSHAQQLLIDNGVKVVTLPQPMDPIDEIFNMAIQEAMRTV